MFFYIITAISQNLFIFFFFFSGASATNAKQSIVFRQAQSFFVGIFAAVNNCRMTINNDLQNQCNRRIPSPMLSCQIPQHKWSNHPRKSLTMQDVFHIKDKTKRKCWSVNRISLHSIHLILAQNNFSSYFNSALFPFNYDEKIFVVLYVIETTTSLCVDVNKK